MTVEFTFGAYFRLCRPQQLSSDLSLHRNVFWEFQGSGHLSAKHFQMVPARREWKGPSALGSLNPQPQTAAPSFWKWYSNVVSLHILKSLPSGKLTQPGDFEEELMSDAPGKGPLSFLSSAYPSPRLCNSPQHHQLWWCLFSYSCQMINLWVFCFFWFFFSVWGGEAGRMEKDL